MLKALQETARNSPSGEATEWLWNIFNQKKFSIKKVFHASENNLDSYVEIV